jgi:hypothetical protein
MKLKVFLLGLLCFGSSFGAVKEKTVHRKPILITVPKSGTHLATKLISRLTGQGVLWHAPREYPVKPHINIETDFDFSDNKGVYHHLFRQFDCVREDHTGRFAKFTMIRDPRDILVSTVNWVSVGRWYTSKEYQNWFNALSFDEQLRAVMELPEEFYSIRFYLNQALLWMKEPDVFVCRFEDLVGPEGGGDRGRQERAIRDVAMHLGIHVPGWKVSRIAEELFGKSPTFRKGQIGKWREHFSKENIATCKRIFGQLLIDLGYETDLNW